MYACSAVPISAQSTTCRKDWLWNGEVLKHCTYVEICNFELLIFVASAVKSIAESCLREL